MIVVAHSRWASRMGVPVAEIIQVATTSREGLPQLSHLPLMIRNKGVSTMHRTRAGTNHTRCNPIRFVTPTEQDAANLEGRELPA